MHLYLCICIWQKRGPPHGKRLPSVSSAYAVIRRRNLALRSAIGRQKRLIQAMYWEGACGRGMCLARSVIHGRPARKKYLKAALGAEAVDAMRAFKVASIRGIFKILPAVPGLSPMTDGTARVPKADTVLQFTAPAFHLRSNSPCGILSVAKQSASREIVRMRF